MSAHNPPQKDEISKAMQRKEHENTPAAVADTAGWRIEDAKTPICSSVLERTFDDIRIFEYRLGASQGTRVPSQETQGYLGLAYVISGGETCRTDGSQISIKPGDILTWDSGTSQNFDVSQQVHKIALTVPDYRLSGTLQKRSCSNVFIDQNSEVGTLLSGYLKGFVTLLDSQISAASLEMTLDFILRGLAMISPAPTENILLGRIFQHIDANLHDPDLSPKTIAEANSISLRYLQTLFSHEKITVATEIWNRRLDRSRKILATHAENKKIFDVALDFGFKDISHFNRSFKRKYGITPGAYRHRCFETNNNEI
jgi:AraC-like DNA-binding protein